MTGAKYFVIFVAPLIILAPNSPDTASKMLSDIKLFNIFVVSLFIGAFSTGVQASKAGTGMYSYPILTYTLNFAFAYKFENRAIIGDLY